LKKEKAVIVGVYDRYVSDWEIDENMKELLLLSNSAGIEVSGQIIHEKRVIDPRFYIGKGKPPPGWGEKGRGLKIILTSLMPSLPGTVPR